MTNEEFNAIYRSTQQPLANFAYRRIARSEVEDVVAETFRIAFEKRAKLQTVDALPWLYRIASNVILNHRRKLAKLPLSFDFLNFEPPVPAAEMLQESDPQLAAAWNQLKTAERAVLSLNVFEELQPREIGVVLSVSANAAAIKLFRAKTKLRELLLAERKMTEATSD
ncbi:MAG: RNA polymerase sigma factor [Micrococcales bacterium]